MKESPITRYIIQRGKTEEIFTHRDISGIIEENRLAGVCH